MLFSMHGNLEKTIIELLRRSPAGLSAVDVATLLEIPSNSSYNSQIKRVTDIKREKHHGRFIYFSETPTNYRQQTYKMSEFEILIPERMEEV
jgi:hypothetical protein